LADSARPAPMNAASPVATERLVVRKVLAMAMPGMEVSVVVMPELVKAGLATPELEKARLDRAAAPWPARFDSTVHRTACWPAMGLCRRQWETMPAAARRVCWAPAWESAATAVAAAVTRCRPGPES